MNEKHRHQEQDQFLDVIDRDEAERRFHAHLRLAPLGSEVVGIDQLLGRVLAEDVKAAVDVPSFDRSNLDGYAVNAADTFDADEEQPVSLKLLPEVIATAVVPRSTVTSGAAAAIATGGMVPRGADAIVMIEHADWEGDRVLVRRAVTAGKGITYAGADIGCGETVLRRNDRISSRETGVLAAIGVKEVAVWRRPKVGILSTGDEIIAPGELMRPGCVFDSNARILADAVVELGGLPIELGIVSDDEPQLQSSIQRALDECDMVLLSGGTSKGAGDVSYRVVSQLGAPGIVAHGVALKPGKPICLAVAEGKPVVILPGFPTSAIFTFHEFVAPVIRCWAGQADRPDMIRQAEMAVRVNSDIGRTEYLLVGLAERMPREAAEVGTAREAGDEEPVAPKTWTAFPMGKGSGSMTTFSRADGIVTIGRHEELIEAGATVRVRLLGEGMQTADLVVIGSHCLGLDYLLGQLQQQGVHCKFLAVGSTAGLLAARRGECDLAGIHLLDEKTGKYNDPFVTDDLELIAGYARQQGVIVRSDDPRFTGVSTAAEAIETACAQQDCYLVNRNQGSGTRVLIDLQLHGRRPPGYSVQPRSHNAVAAAILQQRADWGVAIEIVARDPLLTFLPLLAERFDFVAPKSRISRPAVAKFQQLLSHPTTRERLSELGLER